MYRNAIGFNPQTSMLRGLKGTPNYGKAMAAAATMNFESDVQNKQSMSKQDTQQKQRDMKQDSQNAQKASNKQQYKKRSAKKPDVSVADTYFRQVKPNRRRAQEVHY